MGATNVYGEIGQFLCFAYFLDGLALKTSEEARPINDMYCLPCLSGQYCLWLPQKCPWKRERQQLAHNKTQTIFFYLDIYGWHWHPYVNRERDILVPLLCLLFEWVAWNIVSLPMGDVGFPTLLVPRITSTFANIVKEIKIYELGLQMRAQ